MLISIFDPMGVQTDRLRCEVCQNLILNPMNTSLLRHAVATALTVYGIETWPSSPSNNTLNQVATALTVYGIETNFFFYGRMFRPEKLQQLLPFTVLKRIDFIIIFLLNR